MTTSSIHPTEPDPVRSHLRLAAKIPALLIGPPIIFAMLAAAAAIAWFVPVLWARILFPSGLCAGAVFLGYHMIHTFSWVEFDGRILRARHLYTRRLWVFSVDRITEVRPAYSMDPNLITNAVIDRLIGKVRGYEIMLAGRRRGIWLAVGDTANAAALAEAVARGIGKPIVFKHRAS